MENICTVHMYHWWKATRRMQHHVCLQHFVTIIWISCFTTYHRLFFRVYIYIYCFFSQPKTVIYKNTSFTPTPLFPSHRLSSQVRKHWLLLLAIEASCRLKNVEFHHTMFYGDRQPTPPLPYPPRFNKGLIFGLKVETQWPSCAPWS